MPEPKILKIDRRKKLASVPLVLLCGGVGRRMYPFVTDKSLIRFCGKPLIRYKLEDARAAGIKRVIIVAHNDNAADIKAAVADLDGVSIEHVRQPRHPGMADALQRALPQLDEGPFIVASSNDIFASSVYT
jgi:NDP-sugar pyrophosphorylase family protein